MLPAGLAWAFIFIFVGIFEAWAIKTDHYTLSEFCWANNTSYYTLAIVFAILNLHLFGKLFK